MKKFKLAEEERPKALDLKKYNLLEFGGENIEIKRLSKEDKEDIKSLLKKEAIFIKDMDDFFEYSFGAFLERMLIGVALVEEFSFKNENALNIKYLEIILEFVGRGIKEKLIEEVEKEAKKKGFNYVIRKLDFSDLDNLKEEIEEKGSLEERIYLKRSYKFDLLDGDVYAYKEIL